jgi:predicted GIY-YIG superfamily endonuclease
MVYLLHFDRPLNGRQHYLGWSDNVPRRLEEHRKGQGGKTTARYKRAGIGFTLASSWPGTRDHEAQFKRKRLGSLCPLCQKEKNLMTTLDAMLTRLDGPGTVEISVRDLMRLTGQSSRHVVNDLKAMLEARTIVLVKKGSSPKDKSIYSIPNRSALAIPILSKTVSGTVPERTGTVAERCSEAAEYIAKSASTNVRETDDSTVPRNGSALPTVPPLSETVAPSVPFCPESPEIAAIYGTLVRSEMYVQTSLHGNRHQEFIVDILDIAPIVIPKAVTLPNGTLTYWQHPLLSRSEREGLYSLDGRMRVFHLKRDLHALFFWIDDASPARPDGLVAQFWKEHRGATESSRGFGHRGTRHIVEQAMGRISRFCEICSEQSPSEQYYVDSLSRETDGLAVPPVPVTVSGVTESEADGE